MSQHWHSAQRTRVPESLEGLSGRREWTVPPIHPRSHPRILGDPASQSSRHGLWPRPSRDERCNCARAQGCVCVNWDCMLRLSGYDAASRSLSGSDSIARQQSSQINVRSLWRQLAILLMLEAEFGRTATITAVVRQVYVVGAR